MVGKGSNFSIGQPINFDEPNMQSAQLLKNNNSRNKAWVKMKDLFSPKRIASALLSINHFSDVSIQVYMFFQIIEYTLQLYSPFIILLSLKNEVPLTDIWQLESLLNFQNITFPLYFNIGIIGYILILNFLLIYLIIQSDSLRKNQDSGGIVQKIVALGVYSMNTIFTIPLLHLTIRSFFVKYDSSDGVLYYILLICAAISLILQIEVLMIKRLTVIRVPIVPHSISHLDGRTQLLKYFVKVSYVVAHALLSSYDQVFDSYHIVILLFLLAATTFTIFYAQMSVCYSNQKSNKIMHLFYAIYATLIIISLVENRSYVLAPFVMGFFWLVGYYWRRRMFWKITNDQIKIQFEYQFALNAITKNINKLTQEGGSLSDKSQRFIFAVVRNHKDRCQNSKCLCQQNDSIIWALVRESDKSQQLIDLTEEETAFLSILNENSVFSFTKEVTSQFINNDFENKRTIIIQDQSQIVGSQPLSFGGQPRQRQSNQNLGQTSEIQLALHEINVPNNISNDNPTLDQIHRMKIEDEKKSHVIKINPLYLKKAYFSNLLRIFFEQAIQAFPQNYLLRLQFAYFALTQMRNIFMCVNILRNLQSDDKNHNKIDWYSRINLKVNEGLFIQEIQKLLKKQTEYQEGFNRYKYGVIEFHTDKAQLLRPDVFDSNINPEHFISLTNLYRQFHQHTAVLNQNILEFWKMLIDKNYDIKKNLKDMLEVSQSIQMVQKFFKKIDDQSKLKDFKIYYMFAMVQKYLLNDSQAYEQYLQKTESIRKMQVLLKDNYHNSGSDTEIGVVLCDGSETNFGKLILCNQKIKNMTSFDNSDLRHQSIEIFMPPIIKDWHRRIVEEFSQSGQHYILNKTQNNFIQCKKNYILPVHLLVKYHFSVEYGHTFIALFKPLKELQIWKQNQNNKYLDKVMFFVCDSQELKVVGLTKNCSKLLGLKAEYLNGNEVITKTNYFSMNDICPLLDYRQIKEQQNQLFPDSPEGRIFEGTFNLQFTFLSNHIIREKKFNLRQKRPMRFKVFRESYFDQRIEMFIVALEFIEDNIENKQQTIETIRSDNKKDNGNQTVMRQSKVMNLKSSDIVELDLIKRSNSTTKIQDQIKSQLAQNGSKQTPRSLKFAMQLIILIFLSMISISSLNFYIANNRNDSLEQEIDIYTKSFERIILNIKCKVYVQQMLMIANGLESNRSQILNNKYEEIRSALFDSQDELRKVQSYLDNAKFTYSEEFGSLLTSEILNITNMNEDTSLTFKNQTLTFGMNIMVARLLDIYNMNITQLKGNLSIQTLTPAKLPYRPSIQERTIFFVSYNTINSFAEISNLMTQRYAQEIKQNSENSAEQTKVTIIISICAIALVGFIVTPILIRIQDKQFIAISFFFQIPYDKIKRILSNAENFYQKIEALQKCEDDGEQFKLKIINKRQLKQTDFEIGQSSIAFSDMDHTQKSKHTDHTLIGNQSQVQKRYELIRNKFLTKNAGNQKAAVENAISEASQCGSEFLQTPRQEDGQNNQNQSVNDKELQDQARRDSLKKQTVQIQDIQIKFEAEDDDSQSSEGQPENFNQLQKEELELMESVKYKQMNQQRMQMKFKLFVLCLTFVIIFSFYFIGSYFMALRTYNSIPVVIDTLELLFSKDECLENVFATVRERQIKNISRQDMNFIEECQDSESKYTEFRRQIPESFIHIEGLIQQFEGSDLCEVSSDQFDNYLKDKCAQSINGILKKGISNTIQYILSHFQQQALKMNERNRTVTFLKNLLQDNMTSELIVLKNFIMDKAIKKYIEEGVYSAKSFFQEKIKEYLILFSLFICFLVLIEIVFLTQVFKRIKNYLWKANLSLKILPIQSLPNDSIKPLKQFFANS